MNDKLKELYEKMQSAKQAYRNEYEKTINEFLSEHNLNGFVRHRNSSMGDNAKGVLLVTEDWNGEMRVRFMLCRNENLKYPAVPYTYDPSDSESMQRILDAILENYVSYEKV